MKEIARLLEQAARRIRLGERSGVLLDSNGKTAGRFQLYKGKFIIEIETTNAAFEME